MAIAVEPESFGRLISPRTTCDRLSCSIPTVYELIHSGELESIKLGKYRKILERSVEALIARRLAAAKKLGDRDAV